MQYETLGHMPLLVHGRAGRRRGHDVRRADDRRRSVRHDCRRVRRLARHRTHGHSLVPLLTGTATSIRERALTGVWGREGVPDSMVRSLLTPCPVDTTCPSARGPTAGSTMPARGARTGGCLPLPDGRAALDRMPRLHVPGDALAGGHASDALPFWAWSGFGLTTCGPREDPDEARDPARRRESVRRGRGGSRRGGEAAGRPRRPACPGEQLAGASVSPGTPRPPSG